MNGIQEVRGSIPLISTKIRPISNRRRVFVLSQAVKIKGVFLTDTGSQEICREREKKMEKSRVLEAAKKHKAGFNCCQAVVCTYADLLGIDETTCFRVSEGFGLGIAKEYRTCGSCCAMVLAAGLKNSDANLDAPKSKLDTFALGHKMIDLFEEKNGTSICAQLRGTDGITDRIRSCRGCVMDCAEIIEKVLFEGMFEPYDGPSEFE